MKYFFRWIVDQLVKLNIFDKGTTDEHSKRNEILSTRVYIISLIIILFVLTLITSLQSNLNTITMKNPTEDEYNKLQLKNFDHFQCPCAQISNTYDEFVTIIPEYHEICSSDFLSENWINYLFYENTSYYFQLDFRHSASSRFQLLRTLCQLAQQSITDHLNEYYSYEFITNELLSSNVFHLQIDSFLSVFQQTFPSSFRNLLKLIRQTTISNGIFSAIDTSLAYAFHPSNITRIYMDSIYYYEISLQSKIFDCYCDNYTICAMPEGIYSNLDRYDHPGSAWINDVNVKAQTAGINATFLIDGMIVGCKPIESLMRSTLECLYDRICLNRIGK
ncbi:unnamed protein product, partial [Adineta ricciae]